MHWETFAVEATALRALCASLDDERPIVPVGTTSSRCLETLCVLSPLLRLHSHVGPALGTQLQPTQGAGMQEAKR